MDIYNTICRKTSEGQILNNPLKGTSVIKKIDNEKIVFRRKNSDITLFKEEIILIFNTFKGTEITTSVLKERWPIIFDSKRGGHSCKTTFIFMLFDIANVLEDGIQGEGRKGSPFFVKIKNL